MKKTGTTTLSILMMFSCCAASLATPKNLHTIPTVEHVQKVTKDHSKQTEAIPDDSSGIPVLAKKYAVLIKQAAVAAHLKTPLNSDSEKAFWADYKAGKYSKNKTVTSYMRQAEPLHDRIRAVLKNFERGIFAPESPPPAVKPINVGNPSNLRKKQPVGDFNSGRQKIFDPHKDDPTKK